MLFNSHVFVLIFLPLALAGFHWLKRRAGTTIALSWLILVSLVFYTWWNPPYVLLLLLSIGVNFALCRAILESRNFSRFWLIAGICFNLGLLGYYKYADFFVAAANGLTGAGLPATGVILPLAISFYTFQQVAFLVDTYRGELQPYSLPVYASCVTFFPHLIAGPIVQYRDLMPQFAAVGTRGTDWPQIAMGVTLFSIGLFKKVALADPLGPVVAKVYGTGASAALGWTDAWGATLGYALQIYLDFSGYSDMALGLGHLFGIRLPVNFDSPYQAASIVDFWRRWNITLSNFLRDYLFIPLGGSRGGMVRTGINLMITMLLGGLWHGAAWTFVAWGGLHGTYLAAGHLWRGTGHRLPAPLGWLATFLCVLLAWVLFRAGSFAEAMHVYRAMAGLEQKTGAVTLLLQDDWKRITAMLIVVLALPNAVAWVRGTWRLPWRPTLLTGSVMAAIMVWSVFNLHRQTEFLYFNF